MLTFLGRIGAMSVDAFGAPPDFLVRRPSAMARCRRACKESAFLSGDLMDTSTLSVAGI